MMTKFLCCYECGFMLIVFIFYGSEFVSFNLKDEYYVFAQLPEKITDLCDKR